MAFHEDELIAMCRDLDRVEADLRHREARIREVRMRLRARVSPRRQRECGWVEGDVAEPIPVDPSEIPF